MGHLIRNQSIRVKLARFLQKNNGQATTMVKFSTTPREHFLKDSKGVFRNRTNVQYVNCIFSCAFRGA